MGAAPAIIDVFNGDADGLCALQQLRLADPEPGATLVTGVKRRIRLLDDVLRDDMALPPQGLAGARVTVLDVAFGANRAAVERLLAAGAHVRYFDHHIPGELPRHPALETHIDTSPRLCTSLLVDATLGGAQRAWAVVGAFGDNLAAAAREAAASLALPPAALETLRELGELLNYNGYGEQIAELHFHPADLFRTLQAHPDPLRCAAEALPVSTLRERLAADLALAEACAPLHAEATGIVTVLPDAPWARRIQGTWANRLAAAHPQRATAVGVPLSTGALQLSLRAPQSKPDGADALARRFGGAGRAGAAGIDALPPDTLPRFVAAFRAAFPGD